MGYQLQKLSAAKVNKLTRPGKYGDGGGLWLQVSPSLSKSWIFRFMLAGRAREMGLGSVAIVSLAEARLKALECRRRLLEGIDPIEDRDAQRATLRLDAAKAISFEECANAYIEAHKSGWKNPKHIDQWRNTLKAYAYPTFGHLPVSAVDVTLVLKALDAIWTTKPETASRIRGRIEKILDWATVREFRAGENPARWKGKLQMVLPPRNKVAKVVHHPALPYSEMSIFMKSLREQQGIAARALEFTILTAARTGEVANAKWSEFDLDASVWVIPASRMKAQREHRVPLASYAMKLLSQMNEARQNEYVFPGARDRKPISNMAMLKVLERMKCQHLTVHGFRSSFRDWAAETTRHSHEVLEMALAHTIANKVEAAYRRGELFAKRSVLMEDWARHCGVNAEQSGTPIEAQADELLA